MHGHGDALESESLLPQTIYADHQTMLRKHGERRPGIALPLGLALCQWQWDLRTTILDNWLISCPVEDQD